MRDTLRTPPKLAPDTLRVIPLGGLGDIGRNMTSFEINGELMFIDCGVLFPSEEHPGVDLILPGLHLIEDRMDEVQALVLTHGHEDHIGGIPYLLRRRGNLPIYGSKLTLALVRAKLREHRLRDLDLREVAEGDRVTVGEFELEFLAVNHSIPDALAVVMRTKAGTVLHTGDFKMDQLPLDHRLTDLRGFAKLGEEGVDLFMVDSTNAETAGFTGHERDIEPAMERVFANAKKKLIVACFASHVHRVQQVMDAAVRHQRKVVYVGRSMVRNMTVARELGFLKVPENTLIDLKQIDNYPEDQVVIISTGSQGEPLSALSRISSHEHPVITAGAGDVVLLASSLIPGNENSVYRVINGLAGNGVDVVHRGNAMVHVSGHASAGELLYCYNLLTPRNVLPVHGEVRHLIANAKLAVATGVPEANVFAVEDGAVLDLPVGGPARVVGQLDCSYIFVDGLTEGEVSDTELTDRKILGEEGMISVVTVVSFRARRLVSGPDIHARGFAEGDAVFDAVRPELIAAIEKALADGVEDTFQLQQLVRRTIGRWVNNNFRRRPMILPIVVAS
ncbi:ribonuclease J [Propionicimonas sp.]|uniref:ribonuclease J n=1 Tax=Propionicimonas sp. TaxID=1955623 RepID=UPI0018517094|nr:ribonuclease J [Propionicimonas sp.]MBU3976193.1 ribonuclease J [Actinomycetota bacterium]MBA3021005.1 ribonuclease J [Propionicimonas sp.]MBU3985588.1 ribonuclease J [Actinomycetota bacterium]MBU4008373.1 ribonuclease J [Actinomycetota bacterium]MBU4066477.1 ribonuclease J [Actinomycetota bacterium]